MLFGLGKKKCAVCQQETKECLVLENKERQYLCRNHLMAEFGQRFTNFPARMILAHPEIQKVCSALYAYYPLLTLNKFGFSENDQEAVSKLLASFSGGCLKCGQTAQVLYFQPDLIEYDNWAPLLSKANSAMAKWFCLGHALEQVRGTLQGNPKVFNEGLYAPYDGSGIYISTFL